MISMPKVHFIRQLKKNNMPIAEIARTAGVSRDSVYKYIQEDLSPKPPKISTRKSILDPYKPTIDTWLLADRKEWRKQRHTAHRIWQRLQEEYDCPVSESTVRKYVHDKKKEIYSDQTKCYVDLNWPAGSMQVDFGDANVTICGVEQRVHHFVASFPYSNVGFCQLFFGETAECVCEGLKRVFERIGGVPQQIVFDNATGVGKMVEDKIKTTELFERFAAHYAFTYKFCNPYSGNEKGNVENKVGTLRRNLLVPRPCFYNIEHYNKTLLDKSWKHSHGIHWRKGIEQTELFKDDVDALDKLPSEAFNVERYARAKAYKYAKVTLDKVHRYSLPQDCSEANVIVGYSAFYVSFYTPEGTLLIKHPRAYGSAPTDTINPVGEILLLHKKPRAWENSLLRNHFSENLRSYLDTQTTKELRQHFHALSQSINEVGWDSTLVAAEETYSNLNRLDDTSLLVSARRIYEGLECLEYDSKPDLSTYQNLIRQVV